MEHPGWKSEYNEIEIPNIKYQIPKNHKPNALFLVCAPYFFRIKGIFATTNWR